MVLTTVDRDIWCLDGDPVSMYTIPFQTRMTVVRLGSGELWLHSPVAVNADRLAAVTALGPVAHIVAPNTWHHLFVKPWADTFSDARVWLTPGLPAKLPHLERFQLLDAEAGNSWAADIDQVYFEGSRLLTEMVFFHRASKTLIVTDILQNHDPLHDNWFWKTVKRANGVLAPRGGLPKDLKLTIRDREAARRSVQTILGWDFQRIILSHGICIEADARRFFSDAFAWLG